MRTQSRNVAALRRYLRHPSKSDKIDAITLAKMPFVDAERLNEVYLPPAKLYVIQRLARQRKRLESDTASRKKRIISILDGYLPGVHIAFSSRWSLQAKAFLNSRLNPLDVVRDGEKALDRFLTIARYRHQKDANESHMGAAIIDRETFNEVQELLKQRSPVMSHPRRVVSPYLLSGIVRCGHYGKALIASEAKGGQFTYYVCGTLIRQGAGSCDMPYLNAPKFERLVIDKIKEHILTEENLRELVRLVNEEMDAQASEYRERLEIVMREIGETNHRLSRLYDALETGSLTMEDLAPRIRDLRQRQKQLETSRLGLETACPTAAWN